MGLEPVAVIRSSSDRVLIVVLGFVAVLSLAAAILLHDRASYILAALDLLVTSLLIHRAARARVVASSTGLVAYRSSFHQPVVLTWSEIDQFEWRGSWRGMGAWLLDGRWITLQNYGAVYRAQAEAAVAQLGAIRDRAVEIT